MTITVMGAGAFGSALAVTLALAGKSVVLWGRDQGMMSEIERTRANSARLPGVQLPDAIRATADPTVLHDADVLLVCVPMQQIGAALTAVPGGLRATTLVACAKGIDLATGEGPTAVLRRVCPAATPAVLTGPSFAADIARGLPTALTLAVPDEAEGARVQAILSTPTLRLYRTTDTTGAEIGGALKNVIAIAAGVAIGAGLGDSARAALITRGFAEMTRLATAMGAKAETLHGLSGLGDLILTCTSTQSRNFRYGYALGAGETFASGVTVEGRATSKAAIEVAARHGIDLPVTAMVAALVDGRISIAEAVERLLARPLRKE